MKVEIWKDVIGYENLYQVSDLGNVKCLERNGVKKGGRILKPSDNGVGYLKVVLSNKESKTKYVHRLVYESFNNKNSEKGITAIDHINENKYDNRLCNLQLITQRENKIKSTINKLNKSNVYNINGKYRVILYGKHIGYYSTINEAIINRDKNI